MNYAEKLRQDLKEKKVLPFIGVYDVFSAIIASHYSNALFISGYSFAASHYGMPDIGFITWTDMVDFVRRIRAVLPHHHILVDIDDGYVDIETAKHVVRLLGEAKASGVILEDQKRPKKCGHCSNKSILELDSYLEKLGAVLSTNSPLYMVARTDAEDKEEIIKRVKAFQKFDVDCILVDGIGDISEIRKLIPQKIHLAYNQIYGGKSKQFTLSQLKDQGVNIAIFSTPCLFSAQKSMTETLERLEKTDFNLSECDTMSTLKECNELTKESLSVHKDKK